MKIAIKGHASRGKEIIQILESLGGINDGLHEGNNPDCYYELHGNIIWCVSTKGINFKYYTLEEFEKEFPFKIGDKVITTLGHIGTIINIEDNKYEVFFKIDSALVSPKRLKPYKEMKEERNITLTLDKAKEWYKKGGELKEVALQAYSEEELNPLPRSWEEFITNRSISGYYISGDGKPLACCSSGKLSSPHVCPSKESAEAHLAMIQLEQLRNCYRQGWKPDSNLSYCIKKHKTFGLDVYEYCTSEFLSFKDRKTAEEFLKNFKDLIEKAGNLI